MFTFHPSSSMCMCVYFPSCIIQGSRGAHSVLYPHFQISNTSLNLCMLVVVTSSYHLFQIYTVLCGDLYFLKSFEHRLFLTLLRCLFSRRGCCEVPCPTHGKLCGVSIWCVVCCPEVRDRGEECCSVGCVCGGAQR